MKGLAVWLGALISGLLWVAVIAPLIARATGVPIPRPVWRPYRKNQHLTKRQWVWATGVLGFGVGMFIITTMSDLLTWKLLGDEYSRIELRDLWFPLLMYSVAGGVFGDWTWRSKPDAEGNDSSLKQVL